MRRGGERRPSVRVENTEYIGELLREKVQESINIGEVRNMYKSGLDKVLLESSDRSKIFLIYVLLTRLLKSQFLSQKTFRTCGLWDNSFGDMI